MATTADVIADALKIPAGTDAARDLYAAAAAKLSGKPLGEQESPFPGMPKYPVDYHCERFVMGSTMDFDGEGKKMLTPTSDDEALAKVMQQKWEGKAMVVNRLDTFLQDGTVVVWLEWLTPREAKAAPRPDHARTAGELLDPRVPPASAGAIPEEAKGPPTKSAQGSDVLAPPDDGAFLGEDGPSFEDEADF